MSPERGAGAGELEAAQVRSMFDGIAWVYDALNSAMTAGLHHRWRERAVALAGVAPGQRVLDVATGTGDLALELARRVGPAGEVLGSDFSEEMLARARRKAERAAGAGDGAGLGALRFEWGDALALPYAEDSFDAATVGFGARNFADLQRGLRELARVVRPGGRVMVLEFTAPRRFPLSLFYRVWFDRVVPLLGRVAGLLERALPARGAQREVGIADAYAYLPSSVKRWPGPEALAVEMARAGIGEVRCVLTAGGIVAIHTGVVGRDRA
jgi:demethylmenaquinone methyltransferase/2-methoxy-6-polyprenyl-1,4-benzoquinol methylase